MGKTRVIAETGAGQHGVASATAAAYFGLDCTVYMGSVDTKRQALNVARMNLLGATVVAVDSGSATLRTPSTRGAARLGGDRRPHGLPLRHRRRPAPLPEHGPRLHPRDRGRGARPVPRAVRRAAGRAGGLRGRGLERHRPLHRVPRRPRRRDLRLRGGRRGFGDRSPRSDDLRRRPRRPARARTYVLQDEDGQTLESHSISAGPGLPGVGPQHAHLAATGRASYLPSPTPRRWTRWRCWPAPRASSRLSSRRTRSPVPSGSPRSGRARRSWSASPAAATRDMETALDYFGLGRADTETGDVR